jgi:site-specific DNA recombinase
MLFHRSCERKMQGNWNHNRTYYRCRFPKEYAIGNKLDHPLTVYLREDSLVDPVDTWLATIFEPDRIEQSLTALEQTQDIPDPPLEAARQSIKNCDRKLARYRAALEAGADPMTVASWTREVQAQRTAAEATLARSGSSRLSGVADSGGGGVVTVGVRFAGCRPWMRRARGLA